MELRQFVAFPTDDADTTLCFVSRANIAKGFRQVLRLQSRAFCLLSCCPEWILCFETFHAFLKCCPILNRYCMRKLSSEFTTVPVGILCSVCIIQKCVVLQCNMYGNSG